MYPFFSVAGSCDSNFLIFGLIALPLWVTSVFLIRGAFCYCVTWDGPLVKVVGFFRTKSISVTDLEICLMDRGTLRFMSKNEKTLLTIQTGLIEGDELKGLAQATYGSVMGLKRKQESDLIDSNSSFGSTTEERKANFWKIKNFTLLFNLAIFVFTMAILFEALIDPGHRVVSSTLLSLLPLSCIYVLWTYQGKVTAFAKMSNPFPSIAFALFVLSIFPVFLSGAFIDRILGWTVFWIINFLYAFVLAGVLWCGVQEARNSFSNLFLSFMFCWICAFSGTLNLNSCWDFADSTPYPTTLLGKDITHGKYTSFWFVLSPWGPVTDRKSYVVGKKTYSQYQVGDPVTINWHPGALGISWYSIQPK